MAAIRRTPLRLVDLFAAQKLAALEALIGTMAGDDAAVAAIAARQAELEAMTHGLGQQLSVAEQQGQTLAAQSASAEAMLVTLGEKSTAVDEKIAQVASQAQSLEQLAASLSGAVTSGNEAHAALHQDDIAITQALAALAASTSEAAALLAGRVKKLEDAPRTLLRRASVPMPTIAVVLGSASADVTLTWDAPFPAGRELVVLPPFISPVGAVLIGKVAGKVKSSSATGCVVTLTTTAVLSAGAGQVDVVAYAA